MTMRDIFFLGDSITYGEWDAKGGWVQRLRAEFDEAFVQGRGGKTRIYNLGITGNTSQDLLRRMEAEITPRLCKGAEVFIILAIGMNDAHMMMPQDRPFSGEETFAENLGHLIAIARGFTQNIALVGLNPIDDTKTNPLPWNPAKAYRFDRVTRFNDVIGKVAAQEKVFFIDIWQDWAGLDYTGLDYKGLLCDGIHPNGEGHARIAASARSFFTF